MIIYLKTSCIRRLLMTAAMLIPIVGLATGRVATTVQDVRPSRLADIILLDAGYSAGLRQGMICRIKRGNVEIGDVVVVQLRFDCSAAMIMDLTPGSAIRTGDGVEIKLLKS